MKYTLYIPKEFFSGQLTTLHLSITLIIIIAVVIFFSYKLYKLTSIKKKPESFRW